MDAPQRRTVKGVLGSIASTILALVIVLVATIMFLLKIGVELSFLGSIWSFVTGEWKTGLVLLIAGTLVSVFILS
jgi:ABC-type phosphate transport system permease subunit